MRGRIVASERKADADEGYDHDQKRRAEGEHEDEDGEQHHLDDEHLLAAVSVGQAAQRRGADQDTEQGGCGDDALLGRPQREFPSHQGKATPVVKTTMPSKNLPAAASPQMSHCMLVIGE